MRKSPFLACLALSLAAPNAFANDDDDPWYLQFGASAVESPAITAKGRDFDFDTGFGASLALGRDLFQGDRFGCALELEATYLNVKVADGDLAQDETGQVRATAWMGNLIVDAALNSETTFYVGAGFGFLPDVHYDVFVVNNNDGVIGQFKTGLRFDMGGSSEFAFGYRFISSEDFSIDSGTVGGTEAINLEAHVFELGFRWGL